MHDGKTSFTRLRAAFSTHHHLKTKAHSFCYTLVSNFTLKSELIHRTCDFLNKRSSFFAGSMGLLLVVFWIVFTAECVAAIGEEGEGTGFRTSGDSFRHADQDRPFMLREINQ